MENINYIYHIYEGFENEVYEIFKTSIRKYNLKVISSSDYGAKLGNEFFQINISYETGLQYWCIDIKADQGFMFYKALKIKQLDCQKILFSSNESKREKLLKINDTLYDFFEDEFNGTYSYRDFIIKRCKYKDLFENMRLHNCFKDREIEEKLKELYYKDEDNFFIEFKDYLNKNNIHFKELEG